MGGAAALSLLLLPTAAAAAGTWVCNSQQVTDPNGAIIAGNGGEFQCSQCDCCHDYIADCRECVNTRCMALDGSTPFDCVNVPAPFSPRPKPGHLACNNVALRGGKGKYSNGTCGKICEADTTGLTKVMFGDRKEYPPGPWNCSAAATNATDDPVCTARGCPQCCWGDYIDCGKCVQQECASPPGVHFWCNGGGCEVLPPGHPPPSGNFYNDSSCTDASGASRCTPAAVPSNAGPYECFGYKCFKMSVFTGHHNYSNCNDDCGKAPIPPPPPPPPPGSVVYSLINISAESGAECVTGATPDYYLNRSASEKDAGNWIIFLDDPTEPGWLSGGKDGKCADNLGPNCPACCALFNLGHGCKDQVCNATSTGNPYEKSYDYFGFLDPDCTENPVFCNYNKVIMTDCSNSGWMSDAVRVINGTAMPFRGVRNMEATVEDLLVNQGMDKAVNVLFSGATAGGTTVIHWADRVGELVRAGAKGLKRYKAASVSGVFASTDNVYGQNSMDNLFQSMYNITNASAGVHPECVKGGGDHTCMFPGESLKHTTTPLFLTGSTFGTMSSFCVVDGLWKMDVAWGGWHIQCDPKSPQGGDDQVHMCVEYAWRCQPDQITKFVNPYQSLLTSLLKTAGSKKGNAVVYHSCHLSGAFMTSAYHGVSYNGTTLTGPEWGAIKMVDGSGSVRDLMNTWWDSDDSADPVFHVDPAWSTGSPYVSNPICPKIPYEYLADGRRAVEVL